MAAVLLGGIQTTTTKTCFMTRGVNADETTGPVGEYEGGALEQGEFVPGG